MTPPPRAMRPDERIACCLEQGKEELSKWAQSAPPAIQDSIIAQMIRLETLINEVKRAGRRQMLEDALRS